MNKADQSLEAALARCAEGDRAALQAIFEQEAGRLLGVARRIVRRGDLAEEVVQDAFVLIWSRAGQFSAERGSARGWIYTIVRNRALNIVRDSGREEVTDRIEAVQDETQPAEDLDAVWQRLGEGSQLRRCLAELDETRRRTVLMAYVYGFTHGEIAGRLSVPLGTAKSWVRRGLAALRECMA